MYHLRARFFCLDRRDIQHFMCNRACKYYNDIGAAYLILKICGTLCKYLALATVLFAYFFVAAVHSVMSADNYNTHFITSIYSFYAVQNNSSSVLPSFNRFTTALRQALNLQNIFFALSASAYTFHSPVSRQCLSLWLINPYISCIG